MLTGLGGPFVVTHPLCGVEDSERAIEIPWALTRYAGERRVLDVGQAYAEPRYVRAVSELCVPSLVGIDLVHSPAAGARSAVADVRRPPFRVESLDLVIAISVIEHIGRNNERYLQRGERDSTDPDGDFKAIRTLADVLRPGGRLLLTVPFGQAEDHGWFMQYDADRLARLVQASTLVATESSFLAYDGAWHEPCPPSELTDRCYRQNALAASSVACLVLDKRGPTEMPATSAP